MKRRRDSTLLLILPVTVGIILDGFGRSVGKGVNGIAITSRFRPYRAFHQTKQQVRTRQKNTWESTWKYLTPFSKISYERFLPTSELRLTLQNRPHSLQTREDLLGMVDYLGGILNRNRA